MAAAADDDAKLESFLQWFQANGADLRGCTIRACGGGKGFGVFATAAPEPATTDGVVLVVPLDLAITPMRVLQDPLVGPRCRALFEKGGVDDRLLVMLFLMAERRRPGSLWKPYLDMLPSTFGSSLWFSEEELAELEGTTLYRATVIQRKSLQSSFDEKVKGLVEELLRIDESVSSTEVVFEDFLWANSIFWTRALNIPLPHSYVFPGSCGDRQRTHDGDDVCDSSLPAHQETGITVKDSSASADENSKSSNTESIWVEGLVPGIDFCNHNVKALATWEVDSVGNATGVPASMYLMLADKSSVEDGAEIYINYGNKGNEELLYLYGFVVDNNPDDYLMVHYPVEALRQIQCADIKMKLLEIQKGELRCLLPRSLLDNGFFGSRSNEDKDNMKNTTPFSSYSWSGQRKVPSYLHKIAFPQEFMSTLRTIAMQEHELEQVASLLGEVGSNEDREASDAEIQSAVWEVCGDQGALGLLVDLLRVKMAELEEGSGTEASDTELLDSMHSEDYVSGSDKNSERKLNINTRSCIVYRRGQKQLTRLFLKEAEYLLELSAKEQT
ncbi:hypothetical protein HU200_015042 [Digitaria exilis]|uniref:SET domain-containing protein n=1 Tax=Digitaria exilis TaxID=1010633 RepID=A0A835F9V1_9POAL|nr:hypothetical protein HU200_015042 [Digitaria exilis]